MSTDANLISFTAGELGEAKDNIDALALAFAGLAWRYQSGGQRQITYSGIYPAPYNATSLKIDVVIPLTSGEEHNYNNTKFYFRASNNASLPIPDPDASTRASMVSITQVISWLQSFIALPLD
jgi:hypothetical protein